MQLVKRLGLLLLLSFLVSAVVSGAMADFSQSLADAGFVELVSGTHGDITFVVYPGQDGQLFVLSAIMPAYEFKTLKIGDYSAVSVFGEYLSFRGEESFAELKLSDLLGRARTPKPQAYSAFISTASYRVYTGAKDLYGFDSGELQSTELPKGIQRGTYAFREDVFAMHLVLKNEESRFFKVDREGQTEIDEAEYQAITRLEKLPGRENYP
jgi:hypothetical protein